MVGLVCVAVRCTAVASAPASKASVMPPALASMFHRSGHAGRIRDLTEPFPIGARPDWLAVGLDDRARPVNLRHALQKRPEQLKAGQIVLDFRLCLRRLQPEDPARDIVPPIGSRPSLSAC